MSLLPGCGGDDDQTAAIDRGAETTRTTGGGSGSGGTAARRARLPGPPGPAGPPAISEAIEVWHPLAEAGVPGGNCQPLLQSVLGELGDEAAEEEGGPAYVALYKGIAEGCLGDVRAARRDLGQAGDVGLGDDDPSTDRTCNAQLLLAFGFAIYLNEEISPVCPPPTTTATSRPTTTRGSTTTRATTTTTRA